MTFKREAMELVAAEIPMGTSSLESPTIYVDDIRGFMNLGETVKMGLIEYRADLSTNQVMAVHVGSLVLPASKVRDWANFLLKLSEADDADAASSGSGEKVPDAG